MSDFILDCSVTISWILPDENNNYAEAILVRLANQEAVVPSIWFLEVANVLLVSERRGRTTREQTVQALLLLNNLELLVDEYTESQALNTTLILGREQGLSAYDAAYLELAIRLELPLATIDVRLAEAATRCGVTLI